MIPVLAAFMPGIKRFNQPIDGGRTWRGRRLLGTNKTWRGLLAGTIAGVVWCAIQIVIYKHSSYVRAFSPLDYSQLSILWVGFGLSIGAMIGDAFGSFIKRQKDIQPGQAWFPYDQTDFIIGGIVFSLPFVRLPFVTYLILIVVWLGVHVLFGMLGYWTNTKKELI